MEALRQTTDRNVARPHPSILGAGALQHARTGSLSGAFKAASVEDDIEEHEADCARATAADARAPEAQDAPQLPDPQGASAAPQVVLQRVNASSLTQGNTLFAVLQTMTQARQSDIKMTQLIKRMRTQMQMEAKDRELAAKRQEIKANKKSATLQFGGGMAGLGLSAAAAMRLSFQDQAVNQFVSGAVNVYDQTFGGRAQANEASVVQKQEMNVAQQEQMRVDAASNWFEQVKEARKNAQQAIMTHIQMVGDAINNVWR